MKIIFIIINFGLYYFIFESVFNSFWNKKDFGQKKFNLIGYSSVWSILLGSIIGISIYFLYNLLNFIPMLFLMLIFGLLISIIEFGFGMFFNKLLKFDLWNYEWAGIIINKKRYPLNLFGQINLYFSLLWVLLVPAICYICNIFNAVLYDKTLKIGFFDCYTKIITDFIK